MHWRIANANFSDAHLIMTSGEEEEVLVSLLERFEGSNHGSGTSYVQDGREILRVEHFDCMRYLGEEGQPFDSWQEGNNGGDALVDIFERSDIGLVAMRMVIEAKGCYLYEAIHRLEAQSPVI